jgi:hypothetical protein
MPRFSREALPDPTPGHSEQAVQCFTQDRVARTSKAGLQTYPQSVIEVRGVHGRHLCERPDGEQA